MIVFYANVPSPKDQLLDIFLLDRFSPRLTCSQSPACAAEWHDLSSTFGIFSDPGEQTTVITVTSEGATWDVSCLPSSVLCSLADVRSALEQELTLERVVQRLIRICESTEKDE
jgi:hypothetical protein